MVGSNACYACGKTGHMIRDWPHVKNQAKADTQPRPNLTVAVEPPKRNIFYDLNVERSRRSKLRLLLVTFLSFLFLCAFLDPRSTCLLLLL